MTLEAPLETEGLVVLWLRVAPPTTMVDEPVPGLRFAIHALVVETLGPATFGGDVLVKQGGPDGEWVL